MYELLLNKIIYYYIIILNNVSDLHTFFYEYKLDCTYTFKQGV